MAIRKIQELIDKSPLIFSSQNINKKEFEQDQETKTEKSENKNQNFEIISQIDEKLLEQLLEIKPEFEKGVKEITKDYPQFAKKRQELLFAEIKKIELNEIKSLLPQIQELEIKIIQQTSNYRNLIQQRNKLIKSELLNKETMLSNTYKQILKQKFLLISVLITFGGLLIKLKSTKAKKLKN